MAMKNSSTNTLHILFIDVNSFLLAFLEEPFEFSEERSDRVLDECSEWL